MENSAKTVVFCIVRPARFRQPAFQFRPIQPEIVAPIVTGVVAVALVIHGFGMKAAGRVPKGAEFEKVRAWDAKHPDKSIGVYKKEDVEAASKKGGDK